MLTTPVFIETIRVVGGEFRLLPLHQERMEATCREVFGCDAPGLPLAPACASGDVLKCRVTYGREIQKIEYEPYTPRPVESLRIVEGARELDYHLKSADRTALLQLHGLRNGCDEVIIVRDGLLTDCTYANLLCHTSDGRLLTPSTPLLKGVMRRSLLDSGKVDAVELTAADLLPGNPLRIVGVSLINAMLPPGTGPYIPLGNIR